MEFRNANECISCSSKKRKLKFSYLGFNEIKFECYQCKDCSLVYGSPQPIINEASINEIYSSEYYQNYFGANNDYVEVSTERNLILKKRLQMEFEYYYSFVKESESPKKILDLGCGDGRFLEFFVELGWDCYGIEPSDFVSEIARKKNIKILDKSMLDIEENNKFDFIFMDNVIEHLDYPGQYVDKASELLNESGVIVIKTPNSSGLLEQIEYMVLSYCPKFVSKGILKFLHSNYSIGSGTVHRYGNLHPPVHLSLFNRKSITKALTASGFKNKNIKVLSGSEYFHLWRVKRPKPKGLFSNFLKFLKRLGDFTKRGDMLITVAHK